MFQKLRTLLRRGMSEIDIRKTVGSLYTEEGTTGWGNPCIYPRGRHPGAPLRAHRQLDKGDTLFVDAGANCKGYQCDFARLFVVGNPSNWQKKMHKLVTDMTRECIELVKPGLRASEVARDCDAVYRRAGLIRTKMGIWGREGHGIGLAPWSFEPPSFSFTDNTIITPGMVLTMEPDVSTTQLKPEIARISTWLSDFRFCQEENFLVKRDGVEILSEASRDLHII
jgi:Xaa-Pro aminopeptidase